MKAKILELLESKFQGARKDGLAQIARNLALVCKTEDEAQNAVDNLTEDEVSAAISEWRRETDSEVTKANKKFESGLRSKFNFVEKEQQNPGNPATPPAAGQPVGNGITAEQIQQMIQAAVAQATDGFKAEIGSFKQGKVKEDRMSTLDAILDSNIPVSMRATIMSDFRNRTFESDEAFQQYLQETQDTIDVFKQEVADMGLSEMKAPGMAGFGAERVDQAINDFIASGGLNPSTATQGKTL